jgi:hypothetical protein
VTHEKALALGHLEVEDRLDLVGFNHVNLHESPQRANAVARPELACHHPALAGLPEAVDSGGDDLVITELDFQSGIRRVVVNGDERLKRELARVRVLAQHDVAHAEGFDGFHAFNGSNQSA